MGVGAPEFGEVDEGGEAGNNYGGNFTDVFLLNLATDFSSIFQFVKLAKLAKFTTATSPEFGKVGVTGYQLHRLVKRSKTSEDGFKVVRRFTA